MVLKMYTIFDKLAEDYMPPFTSKNDAVAYSLFKKAINDANEFLSRYALYWIGEYDTDFAMIVSHKPEEVEETAADEDSV